MANSLDLKLIIKHLANGTLGENLCIICLTPLGQHSENIFTKVCKEDKEYCIADVLHNLCQIQFTDTDNFNVCIDCFMAASRAYKFYLLTKRSEEIINEYTEELFHNIDSIDLSSLTSANSLCILPIKSPKTPYYDFDLDGICAPNVKDDKQNIHHKIKHHQIKEEPKSDDDIVITIDENGEQLFYKMENGTLVLLNEVDTKTSNTNVSKIKYVKKKDKQRKKRDPMTLKLCTECPVKYRFVSKLKEHMKTEHNINLYVCKVCKATTCNEEEHRNHLKTHTDVHECGICQSVFKKGDTIKLHLKRHEQDQNMSQTEGAHICEVCGIVLENEERLKEHNDNKHVKKYTCFYCGRMYRGQISFEAHIKKHEMHLGAQKKSKSIEKSNVKETQTQKQDSKQSTSKRKCKCPTCGKYFVDERALLWHQRLHNNERPYTCDVCGRGFVSVNRRNQHALCAHTAPTRRCPLCPALFHLRSMVNTHIKKVHLKAHKRRYRTSKHQNVFWRTEAVPIQDLSVSIQNEILELKVAKENKQNWAIQNQSRMDIEEI